jgi:hypothetical protein
VYLFAQSTLVHAGWPVRRTSSEQMQGGLRGGTSATSEGWEGQGEPGRAPHEAGVDGQQLVVEVAAVGEATKLLPW